jgi:hypothetical protein
MNKIGIVYVYIVSAILWFVYNQTIRKIFGDILEPILLDPMHKYKCVINFTRCNEQHIDGWSISHIIINFIAGYYYPNEYWFIIILSFLTEMFEHWLGFRPRYILDPITNLTAYYIGCYFSPRNNMQT